MFLYFGHIQSSELRGASTLGKEADSRPLSEPLGQPSQVTVTVQIVGVQTAVQRFNKDTLIDLLWISIKSGFSFLELVPCMWRNAPNDTLHR